jgi:transcriptional regulator with XRE-family HTH domain
MRKLSLEIDKSPDLVWKIKSSRRELSALVLMRIAYALGLTASEFMAQVEQRL